MKRYVLFYRNQKTEHEYQGSFEVDYYVRRLQEKGLIERA